VPAGELVLALVGAILIVALKKKPPGP